MTLEQFWEMLEESRRLSGGSLAQQESELTELLSLLRPEEIISFQKHMDQAMWRAFRTELWAAACIMGGGCSDDSFLDFRSCLIARGRCVFERVLDDPEHLAAISDPATAEQEWFYEGLLYVPTTVYESQTHRPMPASDIPANLAPEGPAWDESPESLAHLLPRIFARFVSH